MLTHIVLFKLKEDSKDQIEELKNRLMAMEGQIPELLSIEVGIDVVRSERSYDLALITKFESLDAMQVYQVHPEHQKVIAFVNTVKESTIAVDYEN